MDVLFVSKEDCQIMSSKKGRRPYSFPELTEYGTVTEITLGEEGGFNDQGGSTGFD